MSLRIRRGTEADRTSKVFDLGELIWTTNGQKLYVGDGLTTGGIDIAAQLAGTGMHYNTSTGKLDAVLSGLTTDAVPQGSNNKYFTAQLAQTAVAAALTAGNAYNSHIQFTYDDVNDRITAAVALDGIGLTAISQDVTPALGGNLTLNSHNITGSGNINFNGEFNVNNSHAAFGTSPAQGGEILYLKGITDGTPQGLHVVGVNFARNSVLDPVSTEAGDYIGGIAIKGYRSDDPNQYTGAVAFIANWTATADFNNANPESVLNILTNNNGNRNAFTFDQKGVFTSATLAAGDGTASSPSIKFSTDASADTGFFHPGDGIVCVAINAQEKVRIDGGGMRVDGFMKVKQYSGVLPTPAEPGMIVLDGTTFKGYNGTDWVTLG
jgi:hypothetical protein